MSYEDRACAFFIGKGDSEEMIRCGQYTLEKFKECLGCKHFSTRCESYECHHEDGKRCLLQIDGINHMEKKP